MTTEQHTRRFFSRRRIITWLVLLAIMAAALAALSITGAAERLFYVPSRAEFTTPAGIEDVRFPTTDGLELHGWFFPAIDSGDEPGRPAPTVLTAHGNAGNVENHFPFVDFLPRAGFNVLLFDYRGYGRSDRAKRWLRREDLTDDVDAALNYLLTRDDVDPDRLALYGASIGGALGLPVAARRDAFEAIVLYAPFATWRGVASDHIPLLPRLLIRRGAEPIDLVRDLGDTPVLIVHGDADSIVPIRHGRALAGAAENATLRVSPGAGHNDLIWVDPDAEDAIARFLRDAIGVETQPARP